MEGRGQKTALFWSKISADEGQWKRPRLCSRLEGRKEWKKERNKRKKEEQYSIKIYDTVIKNTTTVRWALDPEKHETVSHFSGSRFPSSPFTRMHQRRPCKGIKIDHNGVGAVKLGHCHLRKLFDRKESLAPIKLFLQTLSRSYPACLSHYSPIARIHTHTHIYIHQLGAFVFLNERRISFQWFFQSSNCSSSLTKLSILSLDESLSIYIVNRHGEEFKIFPYWKDFKKILIYPFLRDETSSILSGKIRATMKRATCTRVICKVEIDRQ